MVLLKIVGVFLLFGAMAVAFTALIAIAAWGLFNGQILIGLAALVVLAIWTWLAVGRRDPKNPEHFKDFGV